MCWPLIDISTTESGSAQIQKSVYKHISQSEIPVTMTTDSTRFLSGIKQGLFFYREVENSIKHGEISIYTRVIRHRYKIN